MYKFELSTRNRKIKSSNRAFTSEWFADFLYGITRKSLSENCTQLQREINIVLAGSNRNDQNHQQLEDILTE